MKKQRYNDFMTGFMIAIGIALVSVIAFAIVVQ